MNSSLEKNQKNDLDKSVRVINAFLVISILSFSSFGRADGQECKDLFGFESSHQLVVFDSNDKFKEAQILIRSALRSHGDQTTTLLNLWRNMTNPSRENASILLAQNGIVLSQATHLANENSIDIANENIDNIKAFRAKSENFYQKLIGQKEKAIKVATDFLNDAL